VVSPPADARPGVAIGAAAIAGVLGAVTIATPPLAWLAWLSVVPFFWALRRARGWLTLASAVAYTLALGTVSVAPWLTRAAIRYFELSPLHAAVITVPSLALIWAAHGVVLGTILLRRPEPITAWAVVWYGAVWVCWEALRTVVFPYYPAAVLAVSQYEVLPVLQLASVCGVAGITYAIIACNVGLAALLPRNVPRRAPLLQAGTSGPLPPERGGAPIIALATGLAIAAASAGFGALRLAAVPSGKPSTGVELGLVDIGATAASARSLETYLAASRHGGSSPSALVWPESALPTDIERDRAAWGEIARFLEATGATLIAGGPGSTLRADGRLARFNSVHVLRPAQGLRSYHKRLLVPFAERWPALLGAPPAEVGELAAGRELSVLDMGGRRFGVLICFEITDSHGARTVVRDGAAFILNPTNDAWFTGAAPHLPWAVIRAVESGVPVVRAANAGVSAVIDRYGRALRADAHAGPASLAVVIVPEGHPTPYARAGNAFLVGCGAIVLIGVIVNRRVVADGVPTVGAAE
jgi:apolipoprotein N-acyltransferase